MTGWQRTFERAETISRLDSGGGDAAMTIFDDPRSLAQELERVGHIVAPELATTCVLAHRLGKPLLCEGSPGVARLVWPERSPAPPAALSSGCSATTGSRPAK